MRRTIKLLVLLTISIILNMTFKINANTNLIEVDEKASIRIKTSESEQGLRFYAKLDESLKDQEHGFYLIYGLASLSELNDAISEENNGMIVLNDKKVFKVPVIGVNNKNEFSVVLTGIPEKGYADRITVFSYVVLEEEIISETKVVRSIAEVALKLIDNPMYQDVAINIVNRVNNLVYYADFETDVVSNYIKNTQTNFGVSEGINWTINNGSGILYDYSDDKNISISQGTNILRINGNSSTTLTSEVLPSVTSLTLDAKHYKDNTDGVLKVFVKGEDDLDFILIETLDLKKTFKTFEIDINKINASIKLEATKGITNLDNIKIYSLTSDDNILKTHKVTFDDLDEDVLVINKIKKPVFEPKKEGYIFAGWYLDNEYLNEFNFDSLITKDIVLFAKFLEAETASSKPPYINVDENVFYINVGEDFTPPVLTAYDDIDDDFLVATNSYFDIFTEGEYPLNYVAIDSSGNEFEVVIRLYVIPSSLPPAPLDYPKMKESELSTIRNRWESTRNGVTARYSLNNFDIHNYYSSLENLEGITFFNELKNIINVRQVSYGDVRFILEKSDLKHSIWGTYQYGIYDGKKLRRYWDADVTGFSLTLNREHVWPRSYLGVNKPNNGTRNIASDIHNLRAIDVSTNSTRSNHYFVDGTGSNGNQGSGTYYPGDDHRGDVARIMFYMHVRYSEELYLTNNANQIKSLTLDPFGRIPFGLLDVLLKWHKEDPVDDFEIYRNNVIYTYQGNRNPFIDYPEYAEVIFNEDKQTNFTIIYMKVFVDTNINLNTLKPKLEELFN